MNERFKKIIIIIIIIMIAISGIEMFKYKSFQNTNTIVTKADTKKATTDDKLELLNIFVNASNALCGLSKVLYPLFGLGPADMCNYSNGIKHIKFDNYDTSAGNSVSVNIHISNMKGKKYIIFEQNSSGFYKISKYDTINSDSINISYSFDIFSNRSTSLMVRVCSEIMNCALPLATAYSQSYSIKLPYATYSDYAVPKYFLNDDPNAVNKFGSYTSFGSQVNYSNYCNCMAEAYALSMIFQSNPKFTATSNHTYYRDPQQSSGCQYGGVSGDKCAKSLASTFGAIRNELSKGLPVVVRVYNSSGEQHWIVVAGINKTKLLKNFEGAYIIEDEKLTYKDFLIVDSISYNGTDNLTMDTLKAPKANPTTANWYKHIMKHSKNPPTDAELMDESKQFKGTLRNESYSSNICDNGYRYLVYTEGYLTE